MDDFIKDQLHPVHECVVCTEPFSLTHQPVALDCKHIFGHKCIARWLRNGRGNNAACPVCRHVLVAHERPWQTFDAASIWNRLCELPQEYLRTFMKEIWAGIRRLWKSNPNGSFTVRSLLELAILPALLMTSAQAWSGSHDTFTEAYDLIAASWDSLGRPDRAEGLAVPLLRLARLTSSVANTLPLYLAELPRTSRMIWEANACLGLAKPCISWELVMEASSLRSTEHFPLLHLYTVLVSQSVAHKSGPKQPLPTRRHELMNLVVDRCCTKIEAFCFSGKPSNDFKETLVFIFQELWRYQHEQSRLSLRGHISEEVIVKGIWAIAAWSVKKDH